MKKRITALLLCLVMVFSLIPTTVWAAVCTVDIKVRVIPVYLDDSKYLGYDVEYANDVNLNLSCQYTTKHSSGANHSIKIKDFHPDNIGMTCTRSGYEWKGYIKYTQYLNLNNVQNPPFKTYYSWQNDTTNVPGTGTHEIYMVYGPKAAAEVTYTLNYDANGGTGAPASQTTKSSTGSATFTISSQRPTRVNYDFKGWSETVDGRVQYNPNDPITVTATSTTLYAVWEEKAPVTPDDPKVDENFDCSKDIVKVICETTDTHNDSYDLKNGYYSVSDRKQLANGNWQCKITIDLDRYFALYDSEHTGHTRDMNHPEATSIMTIYPTWFASTRNWIFVGTNTKPAKIFVKCDATQPEGPGENDTPDMAELLTVECVTADAKHTPKSKQYDIVDKGTLTQATDTTWTYTVTLNRTTYIDKFNGETKTAHTDKAPNDVITLTWNWKNGKWTKGFDENPVIKCECKTEIEPPTDGPTDADVKAALGNVTVTVKCINPGTKHTSCAYGVLGGNDGYQLTKNKDGTYNVVLNAAPFVKAYSSGAQTQKQAHELVSAATLTWVLTFDKESGKWVGEPKEAGVDDIIQTAHRVPVHVVIYRNGDTSQAYADIALNSELPGTVIDLTKLKIGDYYQGDVEFYGWYDDGLWNIYKANVANDKAAPAGMKTATVNGWTNLKCMVYDLDKVVYFQSAEDLAAYQKDHSKNDGLLYTTTVRRGTTLPTADAPAATREGYTFQYWSREGQYQDVTGQTVSGWTNLYAAWTPNTDTPYKVEHYKQKLDGTYVKADTDELTGTTDTRATAVAKSYTGFTVDKTVEGTVESGIIAGDGSLVLKLYYTRNSYIISSDLRINGNTTVKETGKAYSWTHRYGGKFEETIDYTDMFAALKAKTLEVDAANEPYSVDIKLCFPGTQDPANATPYNETILTYGQTGGGWNPGVKNTAYIWGYATTSYQVIFKAEDGTEIETKIVEYGKTVASAAPGEKYGYNFVGWVDQDGNAFTFDNDGNSVTEITRKTVLTAQWAKNVYTIGPDLRINGGEPVKAPGKNYSWSPRYSGEYQDVIDYDKVFEDLTAKVEEVDKDNEPSKIEIKLCFPGKTPANTDEGGLFNEVITYFGQEGASWNPGVKNTAYIWGYATTYYDVSFDSNGGTAVDTQENVQYGTTATKPENPTREGYRFLGWFTKDGEAFDFSTPITKSMTLTAKWEIVNINAYIIPITSDGTQLVGAGFDMALNTTTLGRVGLPGYENEDAVRIHFATFASSAGLADADDYFPGTDPLVVKAVADLKNGLERRFAAGVNEAKADGIMSKTNWTYLHVGELDDKEDTNFLSGNLVFYSARFVTEDSEHVTGMPNAEYTHNAVAVYDYYLDGETITIPDAVPERYGYDFLGWSVKAVPAENDKLLKAGDTVTVDGDVVFTAQWKLKEYTVSFDSKGGTKVDSQIVEHGSTATKPGNPHRNDYTFKGWYLDGKKFDFSTPITGDITLVARWATKTSGGSNSSSDTTTKDNGKTVQSGKTFDGGIALYVGLSVLSATGSALVITKKKRG